MEVDVDAEKEDDAKLNLQQVINNINIVIRIISIVITLLTLL